MAMRNRTITQQQQQLWRPSEQVLHFLTDRKPQPSLILEEQQAASCTGLEPPIPAAKRQAPSVWKPPMAMKANCPALQPVLVAPRDEWQLSKVDEEMDSKPGNSSEYFWDRREGMEQDQQDGNGLCAVENADSQHDVVEDSNGDGELMPPPRITSTSTSATFGVKSGKLLQLHDGNNLLAASIGNAPSVSTAPALNGGSASMAGSVPTLAAQREEDTLMNRNKFGMVTSSPFMKQQVVPQTPLFSGLGSVSFGAGGFSVQQSSSIFNQVPSFAFGSSNTLNAEEEPLMPQQQHQHDEQQQHTAVSNFRLTSTTSASEKGSSDSQAGKTTIAADVQSNNGGFKPSGLAGKSLVVNNGSAAGDNSNGTGTVLVTKDGKTGGRKPRTRPLDLLMNAIQATGPTKAKNQNSASTTASTAQGAASAASGPVQTRNGLRSRAPKPSKNQGNASTPPSKPLRQQRQTHRDEREQRDSHNEQQKQQQQNAQQEQQEHKAFFVHTGVWIVQKKSSRHAKNAFRKKEPDEAADNHRARQQSSATAAPTSNGHAHGPGYHHVGRPLTKKRSLTAISQPDPKQQKLADAAGAAEGESVKKTQQDREAAALIRSKRGRSQALPNRLRDSVINKVKKSTRK